MPTSAPKAAMTRAAPSSAAPVKRRQILKRAAARVASGGKTAGRAIAKSARAGGRALANVGRQGTRVIVRKVKENWKDVLLNEGLGAGAHTATFFADRAAHNGYLRNLEGNPILQWLAKPSNILVALEALGLAFTKGGVRRVLREAMRGTLHAKLGENLHAWFGNGREPVLPQRTTTRGVDDEAEATDTAGAAHENDEPDETEGLETEPDETEGLETEPDDEQP